MRGAVKHMRVIAQRAQSGDAFEEGSTKKGAVVTGKFNGKLGILKKFHGRLQATPTWRERGAVGNRRQSGMQPIEGGCYLGGSRCSSSAT